MKSWVILDQADVRVECHPVRVEPTGCEGVMHCEKFSIQSSRYKMQVQLYLVLANAPGTLHSQRRPMKNLLNAYYLALPCQARGDIQTQDLSSRVLRCSVDYSSEKHLPLMGGD